LGFNFFWAWKVGLTLWGLALRVSGLFLGTGFFPRVFEGLPFVFGKRTPTRWGFFQHGGVAQWVSIFGRGLGHKYVSHIREVLFAIWVVTRGFLAQIFRGGRTPGCNAYRGKAVFTQVLKEAAAFVKDQRRGAPLFCAADTACC